MNRNLLDNYFFLLSNRIFEIGIGVLCAYITFYFRIKHKRMIPYEVKGDDDIPIENDVYIKGCIKAKKRGFWRKDESEKLSQRGYKNVILINGKEEFKCPRCDKIFKHRSLLCMHIDQVHEKKRPFPCTICGTAFTEKGHLKKHVQMVHEGQRPYKCEHCDKAFTRKRYLTVVIQLKLMRMRTGIDGFDFFFHLPVQPVINDIFGKNTN